MTHGKMIWGATIAITIVLGISTHAEAGIYSVYELNDGNTTLRFDPATSAGHFDWIVDGADVLEQQWFWYRIGDTGPEASIDTISTPVVFMRSTGIDPGDDELYIAVENSSLLIEVFYRLTGQAAGTGTSSINEVIRITNKTNGQLPLHFFQYVDFELPLAAVPDSLVINDGRAAIQFDGLAASLQETVVTPIPVHHEAGVNSDLLDSLNDLFPTTLADVSGPIVGDVAWSFQWDFDLDPNEVVIISKVKVANIDLDTEIPEPASLALMAAGSALVLARRRR